MLSLTDGIVDTTTAQRQTSLRTVRPHGRSGAHQSERTQAGLIAARRRGRTGGRKPKMIPALIGKAQRMYDARQFTMAEIATSCAVTPMTIYRHIHTDKAVERSTPGPHRPWTGHLPPP